MEKINTEVLVSSLFNIGFDKVDAALFTYTLGKLAIDNRKVQLFEFSDSETNQIFNKYIDYDGIVFRFKDGINLETMASYNGEVFYPLKMLLNSSKNLIKYLSQLDFSEIVLKKVEIYEIQSLEQIDENIFSQKELEILHQLNFRQTNKNLKLKKDR